MELTILRHGIAVDRSPQLRDRDRELTPKGARRIHALAQMMRARKWSFHLLLTSPYLRAHQTAAIIAEELDIAKRLETSPFLEPDADLAELVGDLRRRKRDLVMIVGHEPALSMLISVLVTGSDASSFVMRKGGMCRLSIDNLRYGRCASLEWLLPPSLLGEKG